MQVISKSELLQTLKEIQCQMYRNRIDGVGAVSWFSNIVNEQDVIDAAPIVHAKWIERKEIFYENEGEVDAIGCSACGKSQRRYYKTNYCPHCGAKMDERIE